MRKIKGMTFYDKPWYNSYRSMMDRCYREKARNYPQYGGELNAEIILSMPHEKAVAVIDAIMEDWFYWMRRAGEYFVQLTPQAEEGET